MSAETLSIVLRVRLRRPALSFEVVRLDLNDILTTLTVLDLGSGSVTGVSYNCSS